MRNAIIGIVIGVVLGVVVGATIIAPKLAPPPPSEPAQNAPEGISPPSPAAPSSAPATSRKRRVAVLEVASAWPTSLIHLGALAKRFEADVFRISAGAVEAAVLEPGAKVPEGGLFDGVATGRVDAAFSSPVLWESKSTTFALFGAVPFGPMADEYLAWFYFGGGKKLYEDFYHRHGVHGVICGMVAPEASGWFRREVRTLDDLKGLKMRAVGLGARVLRKLGVETLPLTSGDIFLALESGAIDAAEFSMPSIDAKLGFQDMAKHYYFPGWHQPSTMIELTVNLERWKELTPMEQAQIETVCGDNVRFGLAEGEAAQFPVLKELLAKGVRIHRWPGPIMEALETAWKEIVAKEVAKNPDFQKVWKSLKTFREDYAIWNELGRP